MNEILINQLKKARIDKGLKQYDVAMLLGIKPNTISNWEKGRTEPDIDTFIKLCNIYDIDCANLLSSVNERNTISSDISLTEYEHIQKYRTLSSDSKRIVDNFIESESRQNHFSNPDEAMEYLKSINLLAAFNKKENFSEEDILQLANVIKTGREKGGL